MWRKILIVALAVGALCGFSAGFHQMHGGHGCPCCHDAAEGGTTEAR